jgi:pilus assembly protein CpaE
MSDKINVLIVDDIPETRENVRKLLQFEPDVQVIGHAASGAEAISMAKEMRPDVVLMDINMPDADGIMASQTITTTVPEAQVIIMSVQSEADYIRRAMLAGARDFLMKPFSGDELIEAVRNVYETRPTVRAAAPAAAAVSEAAPGARKRAVREGNLIAVFSPKGGIGCTTVAINVAVALAAYGHKTLLLDGSLQFGDVGVMLNIKSLTSIVDVVERMNELDQDLISSIVAKHESGLNVLLAPPRPEMAELVNDTDMRALIKMLREMYDFIIVDTSTNLNDVNLALLDIADRIILIARQDLTSLKNVSRFFDLSEDLEYERDKVMLVVNHGSNKLSITVKDIVDTLKWPVTAVLPEDEAAYAAADQGRPLVSSSMRRRPVSKALDQLTNQLQNEFARRGKVVVEEEVSPLGRLARLFRR